MGLGSRDLQKHLKLLLSEASHRLRANQRAGLSEPAPRISHLEERLLMSVTPLAVVADVASIESTGNSQSVGVETAFGFSGDDFSVSNHTTAVQDDGLASAADEQINGGEFHREPGENLPLDSIPHDSIPRGPELIVIDYRVQDADGILANLLNTDREFRLLRLESHSDGLRQITEKLQTLGDVSAIHLLTHGTDAEISLGATVLNSRSLPQHTAELLAWQHSLTSGADLLLYGCDVAESPEGRDFIDQLRLLTGADIAASTDDTGQQSLGGDWHLEYQQGYIQTVSPFSAGIDGWSELLAFATYRDEFNAVTFDGSDGSQTWAADPWVEIGESDGAGAGLVRVTNFLGRDALNVKKDGNGIQRQFDLTGADSAILSFDYAQIGIQSGQSVDLQVSEDGTSWTTLRQFNSITDDSAYVFASFDIGSFISGSTQIRFIGGGGGTPELYIDNVQIAYTTATVTNFVELGVTTTPGIVEETSGQNRGGAQSIAVAPDGSYIVVWTEVKPSGNLSDVFAQRFDATGLKTGAKIRVNVMTADEQQWASAAVDGTGRFVVTWTSNNQDGSGSGVYLRRFNSDGTAIDTVDVLVNSGATTSDQSNSSIAVNSQGDIVVAYQETNGGSSTVFVKQFSMQAAAGISQLPSASIAVDSGTNRINPSVDINSNGDFVVAWQKGNRPYLQRFFSDGTVHGSDLNVNPLNLLGALEQYPVVALHDSGEVSLAYRSEISGFNGIWSKRYHADGSAYGLAIKVGDGSANDTEPSISKDASGNIVIVWQGDDADSSGIYARQYDSNHSAVGDAFLLNTASEIGIQTGASVGMQGLSSFVAVWSGTGVSDANGIFASQFSAAPLQQSATLTPAGDTYIDKSNAAANYGASTSLMVDHSGGSIGDTRSLLQFDLSGIPTGATITGATLKLNATSITGTFNVDVYELTQAWSEGNGIGATDAANWDDRQPGVGWGTAGGSFNPTPVSTLGAGTTGLHSWDITSLVQAWYNGSSVNNGVIIGSTNNGGNTVTYDSSEGTTPPELEILYAVPNAVPVANAGGPYTIDEGQSLSLDASGSSDPHGGSLIYSWDLDDDGVYGESGELSGVNPVVSWATLQSLGVGTAGSHVIRLKVDNGVDVSYASTLLTIQSEVPTANPDSVSTTMSAPVTITALANDIDPWNAGLTILDFSAPANGTVLSNSDGTLQYSPDTAFSGTDTFDYVVTDKRDGLTHFWNLDGGALDAVGSADGVINGGAQSIDGAFGSGLLFDEIDDFVEIPDITYSDEFTVSFKFRIDNNDGGDYLYLYSHGDADFSNSLNVMVGESGRPGFAGIMKTVFGDSDDPYELNALNFDASAVIGDGQWHTYALTVDAIQGAWVFLDGTLQAANASAGGDAFDPTGSLFLGAREDLEAARFFGGGLDSVAIFNRSLTPTEVVSLNSDAIATRATSSATITVSVVNQDPTAVIAPVSAINEGQSVLLDGTGSSDPDGSPLTYEWDINYNGTFNADATGSTSTIDWTALNTLGVTNDGTYQVALRVYDGTSYSAVVQRSMTINNVVPLMTSTGSLSVSEGSTTVTTISATDVNDTISYSISGGADAALFSIDSVTGGLSFNLAPDFEGPTDNGLDNVYDVQVQASDGDGGIATQDLNVTVLDANDNPPVIAPGQVFTVSESVAPGTVVGIPTASDPDTATTFSSWTILSGNTGGAFVINSATGELTTATALDYETLSVYQLQIAVSDGTNTSSPETITIHLTDAGENAPVAVDDSYTVDEGSSLTILAIGDWHNVNWNYRQRLAFSDSFLASSLTSQPVLVKLHASAADAIGIDYSKTQSAGEDLRFYDSAGNLLNHEIDKWDESGYSYVWVNVPAIDPANPGDFIWMYYDNPDAPDGQNATGVWGSEDKAIHHLQILPSDSTANGNNLAHSSIYIAPGIVADAAGFNGSSSIGVISDDASLQNIFSGGGTVSAWINPATWGDAGEGRILDKASSLLNPNGSGWNLKLDQTNGSLRFSYGFSGGAGEWRTATNSIQLGQWQQVAVVYDNTNASNTPDIYINGVQQTLTAIRTPSGTPTSDAGLDLYVGDRFNQTATYSGVVDELRISRQGATAEQILADYRTVTGALVVSAEELSGPGGLMQNDSDADGENMTVTVVNGPAHAANFQWLANGSFLYQHDGSATTSDSFTYYVTDAGGATSAITTVNITINGINDAPTDISLSNSTVVEGTAGAIVGTLSTTDPDPSDSHTYSVDDTRFEVVGGQLKLKAGQGLDFETEPSVLLSITSTDPGGLQISRNFTITVDDTNDNAPVITPGQLFAISESASNGAIVGTVTATDSDASTTFSNWTIVGGNSDGVFTVNSSTGQITIADRTNLDFEATTSYLLTLTVSDGISTSASQSVIVNVTNANDNLPVVTPGQTFTISESAIVGQTIGFVSATDADGTATFSNWMITGGDPDGIFALNASTGKLEVADPSRLDYEVTTSFSLLITVSDGTNTSAAQSVTVNVTDVNDVAPVIDSGQSFSVSEVTSAGASVGFVTASDPDSSTLMAWAITGGNSGNAFAIDASTGEISVNDPAAFDYETNTSFSLLITVSDGTNTSAAQDVTVSLLNANDNAPVIYAATFNVNEAAGSGTLVGIGTASDADGPTTYTNWQIVSGNTSAVFDMNSSTGAITVNNSTALDFETTPAYTLVITVSDGVNTSLQQSITVNVSNANEAPTAVAGPDQTISEGQSVSLSGVASSDVDGDALVYSWDLNADGIFTDAIGVNPTLSWAQLSALGINDDGTYLITLRVTDPSGSSAVDDLVLQVNNTEPSITLTASAQAATGSPWTLHVASFDPGSDTVSQWLIDWGDGQTANASATSGGLLHTFSSPGNFLVTVTPVDEDGTHTASAATISVEVLATAVPANDTWVVDATTGLSLTDPALGVTANDSGVSGSASVQLIDGPSHASSFRLNADGTFSYQVAAGYTGVDSFRYRIIDGVAVSEPAVVTLSINQPPALSFLQDVSSIDEGTLLAAPLRIGQFIVNDDGTGTNVVSLTGTDSALFSIDSSHVLYLNAGIVPSFNLTSQLLVTGNVDDSSIAGSPDARISVMVSISNINHQPIATPISNVTVDEDSGRQTTQTSGAFSDPDREDTLQYAVQVVSNPDNAIRSVSIDSATGEVGWFTSDNANGDAVVRVTAMDPSGAVASSQFTIHVTPIDDAPIARSVVRNVWSGVSVFVSPVPALHAAVDVDGQLVSLQILQGPEHGSLSIAPDGTLIYVSASDFVGIDQVLFVSTDGTLDSDVAQLRFWVRASPLLIPSNSGSSLSESLSTNSTPGAETVNSPVSDSASATSGTSSNTGLAQTPSGTQIQQLGNGRGNSSDDDDAALPAFAILVRQAEDIEFDLSSAAEIIANLDNVVDAGSLRGLESTISVRDIRSDWTDSVEFNRVEDGVHVDFFNLMKLTTHSTSVSQQLEQDLSSDSAFVGAISGTVQVVASGLSVG
ncbi:MAG: DUF2341 domain-containing protein, partial [Planctomycetaceae bacterium]|nr:DUF2341 domain-containing protein [Planctomycetaceae bacterium]